MFRIDSAFSKENTLSTDKTKQTLKPYQGQKMILSFFMPNCRWCLRQHQVLKRIHANCPMLNPIMIGVQASKQKLKLALKRKKNTFPAFVASRNMVQAIGENSPVPMLLFFNEDGHLIFKTEGYLPESQLVDLLSQKNLNFCQV
jgi:thioredoxin-related protein